MRRFFKSKTFWVVAICILAIAAIVIYGKLSGPKNYKEKYADLDMDKLVREGRADTYNAYFLSHKEVYPKQAVEIPMDASSVVEGDKYEIGPRGGEDKTLISYENGYVVLKTNVPEAGFYYIDLSYYPDQDEKTSRGIEIERCLSINGDIPFSGADTITLPRVWTDGGLPKKDNQGNEIRPAQVELPRWEDVSITDELGYITTPYCFYFNQGENTIRFDATQETLILRSLVLRPVTEIPSYAEYISGADVASSASDFNVKIDGEKSKARSSQSLYSSYDRSSAGTEPYDVKHQVINMGGGQNWKYAGQWIEWEVEVPSDGYYRLTLKTRQNYNRGYVSCRSLYINGEIPFKEVSAIKFDFDNDWQMLTLANSDGDPYLFHLNQGVNRIRLQVTLGAIGDILTEMTDSVFRMNQVYRRIIVYTGTEPDPDRDYNIRKKYPDVITSMETEAKVLYKIIDELVEYTGESGTQVSALLTLATQLERFVDDPDKIPGGLGTFKINVSSLGTSILNLSESNLDIDYMIVSGTKYDIPDDSVSWLDKAAHEVRAFLASFVVDYNAIGNVYEGTDEMKVITVWIFAGRDQCTILKDMIDDDFVPKYHIGVNVDLMTAAVLLPATVAKTGPDVALNVASGEPVNYALRGASIDLTQFKGDASKGIKSFEECFSEFMPSSYVPYKYTYKDENGNDHEGVFGLPETQYYNLMFYRTDILEELGLTIPDTWEDLIAMLPVIQNANMNVGVPSTERKINGVTNPDMNGFFAQLYQRNGKLYNDNGSRVLLDGDIAVDAFEYYTMFFTHYKTPTDYNFVDRFRTGEMPIGFVDFNNYNTLIVSAPEIRGLWAMAVLPGTPVTDEDGNPVDADGDGKQDINRSCGCWGTCAMILGTTEYPEESWAFMQWWGDSDIQARYGKELEAVMGESARYASANVKAFDQLAWNSSEREMLLEQWNWVVGTPEVPGGYYINRHIINAIRKVMNQNMDPRETLLDYTRDINDELIKKRKEFGLPTE